MYSMWKREFSRNVIFLAVALVMERCITDQYKVIFKEYNTGICMVFLSNFRNYYLLLYCCMTLFTMRRLYLFHSHFRTDFQMLLAVNKGEIIVSI